MDPLQVHIELEVVLDEAAVRSIKLQAVTLLPEVQDTATHAEAGPPVDFIEPEDLSGLEGCPEIEVGDSDRFQTADLCSEKVL
jgi:hypothetical protein